MGRIRGVASPEIKAARDRMLQVLETAVANGSLKSALDDIFGQDNAVGMEQHGAAVTDRLEDTRKKLHSDLQSATRTGGLQEALDTAMKKFKPSDQASQEQTINHTRDAPASC